MNKIIGLAILAAGILLAILGFQASESFASDFSNFFTGSPTDRSIWLMIGGIVLLAIGGGVLLYSPKRA
ncbi:MAG: DUF3185 family protein [Planctomycetes bacterium]|nr:DUF3185 family protein [Planctomycetota bacterium]